MFQQPNNGMKNGFNPYDLLQKFNEVRQDPRRIMQYLSNSGRIPQQMLNEIQRDITGNPRQVVQNLLSYGMMSQQEFNIIAQIANEVQKFMP